MDKKIKLFEKAVSDGMQPNCPNCGNNVDYSGLQSGESGAKGYKYRCDNIECNTHGFAYIPWHTVLFKALQKKILQLGLVAVASVSITMGAGYGIGIIKFTPVAEGSETDSVNSTDEEKIHVLERDISSKEGMILSNDALIKDMKSEVISLEDEIDDLKLSQVSDEENINLGIYYSLLKINSDKYRNNSDKAKELLFNAIKKNGVSYKDERWVEIIRSLVWMREKITNNDEFDLLIELINKYYIKKYEKNLALAEVYWAYAYLGDITNKYERSLYHWLEVSTYDEISLTEGQIKDIGFILTYLSKSNDFVEGEKDKILTALSDGNNLVIKNFNAAWSAAINYM